MLGVSTAGAPPGLSAQGVLLQQGFVSPAPAGGIKSTLGSSETTAGPCTGAVPPKPQLCSRVRSSAPGWGSPQGTQKQLLGPGKPEGPPTMLWSSALPRTSPDLPGIQGPLLSSAAARARCEISPVEMLAARIYGFCSFPFMAPAGEELARDERCSSGRDGRRALQRLPESHWDTRDPPLAALQNLQQPLPPQAQP